MNSRLSCDPSFESLGEMTVAMAQAKIQNAFDASNMSHVEICKGLGVSPSGLSRIMSGSRRLSVQIFGEILVACGFEVRFELVKREPSDTGGNSLDSAKL